MSTSGPGISVQVFKYNTQATGQEKVTTRHTRKSLDEQVNTTTRTGGLCALGEVDPAVTKKLRVHLRLANIRKAHRNLVDLLRGETDLEHLIQALNLGRSGGKG